MVNADIFTSKYFWSSVEHVAVDPVADEGRSWHGSARTRREGQLLTSLWPSLPVRELSQGEESLLSHRSKRTPSMVCL